LNKRRNIYSKKALQSLPPQISLCLHVFLNSLELVFVVDWWWKADGHGRQTRYAKLACSQTEVNRENNIACIKRDSSSGYIPVNNNN